MEKIMTNIRLEATLRTNTGKGASRRLRRTEKIPAIVYGAAQDPVMLAVDSNRLRKVMENEAFFTQIINLEIEGKAQHAVLRDIQRHPAKDEVIHLDFLRITGKETITMTIPLHFENESTCPGVKKGGIVSHVLNEVTVKCLPKNLPEFIAIDLAAIELDQTVHMSDIQLPKGVEFAVETGSSHDTAVVSVHLPKRVAEPTEAVEELEDDSADDADKTA
jgi:large subunit ribosomal protein L25